MVKNTLAIVPLEEIPLAVDTPTDNLMEVYKKIVEMEDLCSRLDGIGLCAPQVGIPWKLFIAGGNHYLNCSYEGIGDKIKTIESCLSLQGRYFEVHRYPSISLKGMQLKIDSDGKLFLENIDEVENGMRSIVLQHEIDHFSKRERMVDVIGKEIDLNQG